MNEINRRRLLIIDAPDLFVLSFLLSIVCIASSCSKKLITNHEFGSSPYVSKVWVADNGDGTYKNPVLYADYSDPDVIRVGSDYYLVASSFNCNPGLPILHSKDLVNWSISSYALPKQEPRSVYDKPQHGKGVWAPSIRYHNHEFYIYYPDPDYGVFVIKTKDINREWTKPELVLPGKGVIDPCPLWDDDGKVYLITAWAASRAGVNSLLTIFRMNSEGTKVTDEGKNVFDGHDDQKTIEGPKLYKKDGFYYIFAPAGGVTTGWQVVLRSRSVYGPYEAKVVLDQGTTIVNGPHQGAWVQTENGDSWFLHFQDRGAYGRVVHLEPVQWVDNWPVIGKVQDGRLKGQPVSVFKKPVTRKRYPVVTPAETDEFNSDTLGLQWQWQANHKISFSALIKGTGYLRLFAFPQEKGSKNLWETPNILLQKFPAPDFSITTKVSYQVEWDAWQGKKAGLVIMGNDYAYLAISKNEKGFVVSQVICKNAPDDSPEEVVNERPLNSSVVYLKVSVSAPEAVCQFSYSEDGKDFKMIGKPFTAKQDKWTGAKVGIFCTADADVRIGGYADFDWFRVDKNSKIAAGKPN